MTSQECGQTAVHDEPLDGDERRRVGGPRRLIASPVPSAWSDGNTRRSSESNWTSLSSRSESTSMSFRRATSDLNGTIEAIVSTRTSTATARGNAKNDPAPPAEKRTPGIGHRACHIIKQVLRKQMPRQPTTNTRVRRRLPAVSLIAILVALAVTSCNRPAPAKEPAAAPTQLLRQSSRSLRTHPSRSVRRRVEGWPYASPARWQNRRRAPAATPARAANLGGLDLHGPRERRGVVFAALAAGGRSSTPGGAARPAAHFVLHYSANRVIGRSMSRSTIQLGTV